MFSHDFKFYQDPTAPRRIDTDRMRRANDAKAADAWEVLPLSPLASQIQESMREFADAYLRGARQALRDIESATRAASTGDDSEALRDPKENR